MSSDWGRRGKRGIKAYLPLLRRELLCEETTAATSCPCCGNPTVVPGQFGMLKPTISCPSSLASRMRSTRLAALPQKAAAPFSRQTIFGDKAGVYVPF